MGLKQRARRGVSICNPRSTEAIWRSNVLDLRSQTSTPPFTDCDGGASSVRSSAWLRSSRSVDERAGGNGTGKAALKIFSIERSSEQTVRTQIVVSSGLLRPRP